MKKFTSIVGSLALLTSSLMGETFYRTGYSNGSNISMTIKTPAFISVYMMDSAIDYKDRILSNKKMEPTVSTSVTDSFTLNKVGYYVIKVETLNDAIVSILNR